MSDVNRLGMGIQAAMLAAVASMGAELSESFDSATGGNPTPGRYHEDHPSDPAAAGRAKAKAEARRERRNAKRLGGRR